MCWRRIRNLKEAGVIQWRAALPDRDKPSLARTVFVAVKTNAHNEDRPAGFADVAANFPEAAEFYRMSGDIDDFPQVATADVPAYDAFCKRLAAAISLNDALSGFAMKEIKRTAALLPDERP